MREVADKIALLHKLSAEMNEVCKALADLGLTVTIETRADKFDYLASAGSRIKLAIDLVPKPRDENV